MSAPDQRPWWERVSPELVAEHVRLTRDTRQLQRYYRRTIDAAVRTDLANLERQLDALGERLHAELVAAEPVPAAEEGGAA